MHFGQFTIIFLGVCILWFLAFCLRVVKRHWLDKKGFTSTSQFIGENIIRNMYDQNARKSVDKLLYLKENWKQEDDKGEDKDKP